MKKAVCISFLLLILALCGCSVKQAAALETIECPVAPDFPAFYLSTDLPSNTSLISSADEGRRAVFAHEDYLVLEEIFAADSLGDALLHLTGRKLDENDLVTVSIFPQKEYRLTWSAAGETGDQLCSTALFYDGTFYYALTVQCDAAVEKEYRAVFSDLLSTTELAPV